MYTNFQNNLPQNEAQPQVFFDNVSQNVLNLTGRHNIASQSNSKSAQDGSRSNIGGSICHDSCVVGHFACTTKKECPCTSDGVTVNHSTPNWLVRNTWHQEVTIHDCDAIPDGPLVITHSQVMVIAFLNTQVQLVSEHEKSNAKLTAMNFYQDQYAIQNYHMSYEQYMDRVILSLIERQDKVYKHANCELEPTEPTAVNIPINVTNITNKPFDEDNPIPHYFEAQIVQKLDKNVTDVNLKNKTRGFLNLESTNFNSLVLTGTSSKIKTSIMFVN